MTSRAITFAGFALIVAFAVGWAAIMVRRPNSMTLDGVVRRLTRTKAGLVAMLAGWAWLGWHLFARGSGAFNK